MQTLQVIIIHFQALFCSSGQFQQGVKIDKRLKGWQGVGRNDVHGIQIKECLWYQ